MKKSLIFALTLLINCLSFAQIQVQNTLTPQELVETILVGSGVTPTNVTVNGSAADAITIHPSASFFDQNGTSFPIANGVLLTTGNGSVAVGPNNSGSSSSQTSEVFVTDPDMAMIATGSMNGGIVLEFDFIATGNELSFDYIFASEEYPEFVNGGVNDCFGFFLSGPGLNGIYSNNGVNLALIPGTQTPITIDDVNAGSNSEYYVDNVSGLAYGSAIQYDGLTTVLTAFSQLECGETYHIKMGITNISDNVWDSGVFLQGGSFSVNPIAFTFDTYTIDNTIYESCEQLGTIMFTREGCDVDLGNTLTAYTFYSGQAINGVDYQTLGDSVFFDVGEDTIYWQLLPIEDLLDEGIESVDLTIMTINSLGDTVYSYGTFYISDNPDLIVTATGDLIKCEGDSAQISVTATGLQPITYEWNTAETDSVFVVQPTENGIIEYIVTATDFCGTEVVDTAYLVVDVQLSIDTITSGPATCDPTGWVNASVSGYSDPINVTFEWTNQGDTNIVYPDQSTLTDLGGGWYILTFTDDNYGCVVVDSVFVETTDLPQAIASVTPNNGCSPLTAVFSNDSENASSYTWDFGNGNIVTTTSMSDISQIYTEDAIITLTASNGNPNCDNTTMLAIDILPCGCIDPTATNYNPLAVYDDGSCTYPVPTVTAPNVFTPNGDFENPFFILETEYATSITFTILNRWGNIIFTGSGTQDLPPVWNGKTQAGVDVEEGVYFYRYTVTGFEGAELEGHGFVQVVR